MRRRTGKVARLPLPVRNHICEMLRDGCTYQSIIDSVAQKFPSEFESVGGLSVDSVGQWMNGSGALGASSGYREWLAIQERVELAHDRHAIRIQTQDQLRAEGLDPNAATAARLAEILDETLEAFDSATLHSLAKQNPARVLTLLSKVQSGLTKGHIDFAKLQIQHEKLKRSIAEASGQLEKLRHTTTDEDRQRIIDAVNQTLGLTSSTDSAPVAESPRRSSVRSTSEDGHPPSEDGHPPNSN